MSEAQPDTVPLTSENTHDDQKHTPTANFQAEIKASRNPISWFIKRSKTLFTQVTTSEISGSLGDLGTLIPLLVALARNRSVLLAPALFFGGLGNIITGFVWDVPMCVQPMKSIAAVALSENLSREAVTASGILTGAIVFFIGITDFIEIVNIIVPVSVVSGLQIGVGMRLAGTGFKSIQALSWMDDYDCLLLAIVCALLCLYWLRERSASVISEPTGWSRCCCQFNQHPVGIYLFVIGSIFAIITLATVSTEDTTYDLPLRFFGAPIAVWALGTVNAEDWKVGFLEGTIPQLPLTTLNSVISVCALAHVLYPDKRTENATTSTDSVVSRREVATSVGLMNVLLCPFGAMPTCHGAGGLAGQHKFGARHGASVVFLGLSKVFIAVFFGASALTLLDAFPSAVLGVMVAIAGQELATTGITQLIRERDSNATDEIGASDVSVEQKRTKLRKKVVVAVVTAMVVVFFKQAHYGSLCGWITHMVYSDGMTEISDWWKNRLQKKNNTTATNTQTKDPTDLDLQLDLIARQEC